MKQSIKKSDIRNLVKKIIKESAGIPSEDEYYINIMVPRIKSWMDEVYQDWGGIDAVSPQALMDFSNRNDYEEALDTFAHEFNINKEQLKPMLNKALEIAHNELKEDLLGEGREVDRFTPYTPEEKARNFEYLRTGFGRSPEERNPSYAKALKAAEERRRQKQMQQKNVQSFYKHESKQNINNKIDETVYNMNKKLIRLTESDLHRVIKESVKRILNEKKYPNPMGGPESRINAYPEYAADFDDGSCEDEDELSVMPIPNRDRLHTLDRTTDAFADWEKGDHAYYEDGDVYPSAEWSDTDAFGKPNHYHDWSLDADKELEKLQNHRFKNNLDKQWQDTKDMEKIFKQADSRPLHRKGSLNRAMGESLNRKVNRIVSECLRRYIR